MARHTVFLLCTEASNECLMAALANSIFQRPARITYAVLAQRWIPPYHHCPLTQKHLSHE